MAFTTNIRGFRIDGNSNISGNTFTATTYINVGGITGAHINPTYLTIGAKNTGGYNGSYGTINARAGNTGLNRLFVGEVNTVSSASAIELRSYNAEQMSQLIVNGSSIPGSFTGTTLAKQSTVNLNASLGYGGFGTGTFVKTTGADISLIGSASTNYSTRLDSNGYRVTTMANVNTTNIYPFSVNDKLYYQDNDSSVQNILNLASPNGSHTLRMYAINTYTLIQGNSTGGLVLNGSGANAGVLIRADNANGFIASYPSSGSGKPAFRLDSNAFRIGLSEDYSTTNAVNGLNVSSGNVRIGTNVAATHKLEVQGDVMITALSATTATTNNRMVEVNSSGETYAYTEIVDARVSSTSATTLLSTDANWDSTGAYIGTTITDTYAGQTYSDSNFFYIAVADNSFIRIPRTQATNVSSSAKMFAYYNFI